MSSLCIIIELRSFFLSMRHFGFSRRRFLLLARVALSASSFIAKNFLVLSFSVGKYSQIIILNYLKHVAKAKHETFSGCLLDITFWHGWYKWHMDHDLEFWKIIQISKFSISLYLALFAQIELLMFLSNRHVICWKRISKCFQNMIYWAMQCLHA